jgi:uncharacterized protein involved in exopolysaccharide biosynthesis/Mrp family chromosome partitioning ATPase
MYKVHVKRTAFFAILGLLVAMAIVVFSPKIYEARVEMLLGSNMDGRSQSMIFDTEVQKIIERNAPQGVQTERQLLNSETVYLDALNSAAPGLLEDWEKFYLMYEVVTARTPNQNEIGAGVAQIRVRTHDRQQAERIADAVTVSYNEIRQRAAADAVASAISYLQVQIDATDRDLKATEAAYQKYKEEQGIADFDRMRMVNTDAQSNFQTAIESAKAEIAGLEETIAGIDTLIDSRPDIMDEGASEVRNPNIDRLETTVLSLENERSVLLTLYTESNPRVKSNAEALEKARARLAEAKTDPTTQGYATTRRDPIKTSLETQREGSKARLMELQARVASLQSSLEQEDLELAATPEQEVMLTQLQRERLIFDNKYQRLKSQLEELTNRRETGTLYGVVLGGVGAQSSPEPVAPEPVKLGFIGFIAGACIGLVFSFALEALRPRVYTSGQLADLTGLPVVASIPALGGLTRSKAIEQLASSGGPAMESFRSMAYTFLAAGDQGSRTVLFTGIGTAGSSSFGAAQFAVALAQAGTRTILVDAERTRQVVTNGFKLTDKRGVSNAFQEGGDAATMLVDTKHDNLQVLPIGTVPETMAKAAVPERIEALIASLRQHAEVVVISVAPADLVADAAAFASKVDEVSLCVSAKSNEYGTVPTAFDILDKAGAKSVKLILSDTSRDSEPFSAAKSIQRAG